MDSVGSRVQDFAIDDQVLVLGQLAQDRSEANIFSPADVDALFDEVGLPRDPKVSNVFARLRKVGYFTSIKGTRGAWKLTPNGVARVSGLASAMDLASLVVEASRPQAVHLGATAHPVIPPSLAPPGLVEPLRRFLAEHPFERNVFGMTRFPGAAPDGDLDPLTPALTSAADVCRENGLEFHLASDRSIVDDLWSNVAAHMWGCRFGIAFFEARTEGGLNYNLSIEVGSCLVLGRRMALLKDHSLEAMPTDLVGQIYLEVDLDDPKTVANAISGWVTESLNT